MPGTGTYRRVVRSHGIPPSENRLDRWVLLGFIALLALMPLLLGVTSQRPWPILIARTGVLLLFVTFWVGRWRDNAPIRVTGLWTLLFAGLLFTLFQLVPLPPWLLELLSPEAARVFRMSLDGMGLYGADTWRPLSLDPAETWQAASAFAGLLMVYLMAVNLMAHDRNLGLLVRAVAVIGFSVALIGFVQKVVETDKILGFIPFKQTVPFFFSTFVNANHLAAFLGLSVPLQLSLALKSSQRQSRILFLLMALVTASAIFMSLSRGGIIAFLAGQLLLAFLLLRRRRAGVDVLWIQLVVVVVLAVSSLLAMHELASRFDTGESWPKTLGADPRTELWEDTLSMVRAYPLTGIGAEAFKVAHPLYKTTLIDRRFTHPENILLQVVTESGMVMGGLLVAGVLVVFWRIFRQRHMKRYEVGAFSALVAVGIHNYVDFNLSSYAVAVPFVALLGILELRAAEQGRFRWPGLYPLSARIRGGVVAVTVVALTVGLAVWWGHRLPRDQARLHAAVYGPALSEPQVDAVLAATLTRHPADYYLRLLASERYRFGSYADLPLKVMHLNKAWQLNPKSPQIPMMLGRAWAAVGDTARAREAFTSARTLIQAGISLEPLWSQMRRAGLDAAALAAICPPDEERVMELARYLVREEENEAAKTLLTEWMSEPSRRGPQGLYLLGFIALSAENREEAEATGRALVQEFPKHPEGYLLLGRVAGTRGESEAALEWYQKADHVSPYNLLAWFGIARNLTKLGRLKEAEDIADKIHGISWNHYGKRLSAHILSGDIDLAQKKYHRAQQEYERALLYAPRHGGIHFKLALVAEARGDRVSALKHYRLAKRYGYQADVLDAAIRRLSEAAPDAPEAKTP